MAAKGEEDLVFDSAAELFALAAARGDHQSLEHLAAIWLKQGKVEDARDARQILSCCGASLGQRKWAEITDWLTTQGVPAPSCKDPSQAPVELPWED